MKKRKLVFAIAFVLLGRFFIYAQNVGISTDNYQVKIDTRSDIEKLSDKELKVRKDALLRLKITRNTDSLPYLVKMLKDDNGEVRRLTVDAIVIISTGNTAGAPVLELLKSEKDSNVQLACINALVKIRYSPALPELKKLAESPSPVIRTYALTAFMSFNDPSTYKLIEGKIGDNAEGVRIAAMHAAAELKLVSVLPLIRKNLKYPVAAVKREALLAIGSLGTSNDIACIKELLKDKDESVGRVAQDTLEKLSAKKPAISDKR